MNTMLLKFVDGDFRASGPRIDPPVTIISPAIPGFLMRIDCGDIMFGGECGQNINRIARADDQRLAKTGERRRERGERVAQKGIMAGAQVRLRPLIRLDYIEGQHRARRGSSGKRGVIPNAQIPFKPDNIHSLRPKSVITTFMM